MSTDLMNPEDSYVPNFLTEYEGDVGLENVTDLIKPPRLMVVQKQTKPPLDKHPLGTVVITPDNKVVCEPNGEFAFTPILVFRSYNKLNPEGFEPWIIERSYDPESDLAAMCKFDEETKSYRSEPHPEDPKKDIKYAEFIEYLTVIHCDDGSEQMALVSFFSTRYKNGKKGMNTFASFSSQDTKPIPIFAGNFCMYEAEQPAGNNTARALNVSTLSPELIEKGFKPFVTNEQFRNYADLYKTHKKAYQNYSTEAYEVQAGEEPVESDKY